MIGAEAFHRGFGDAFAPGANAAGLARDRRKRAKWKLVVAAHPAQLAFVVNPKVAGLPDVPGDFKPVISWQGPRHGPGDYGTVSYYQYATDGDMTEMQGLRRSVVQKVAARAQPNPLLSVIVDGLDIPLRPNHPDVPLYYFDEDDAAAWGGWFGARMRGWCERFAAAPETLESWCWRVLWKKPVS